MEFDSARQSRARVDSSFMMNSLAPRSVALTKARKPHTSGTIQNYLIYQASSSGIRVEMFHEVQDAHSRWMVLSHRAPRTGGLLFTGFGYPSLSEARRITSRWPGRIVIAESCRRSLPPSLSISSVAIDQLPGCPQHPRMACYFGGNGWTFDVQNRPKTPPQVSPYLNAISGDGHCQDVFEAAKWFPDWALDISVGDLPLPVRCRTILSLNGVKKLGDLRLFSKRDALRWAGFGQKSLKQFTETVTALLLLGKDENGLRIPFTAAEAVMDLLPMMCLARRSLTSMSERDTAIWTARLGLGEPRQTLRQLGEALDLTSERVRQIEIVIANRYRRSNPWVNAIVPRIKRFLDSGRYSLRLEDLEHEDGWFLGISAEPQVLNQLLRHFGTGEFLIHEHTRTIAVRGRNRACRIRDRAP